MKVLHVSTHLNIGGIGNYILSLSGALKKKGIIALVASSGGDLEEEFKSEDVAHKYLDIKTKFEFGPKVLRAVFNLCRIIKDEGVDIVHAHTRVSQVAALLACRITGIPYVTTCHGFFKKRLRGVFDTWGQKVIAISDAVKNHLEMDLGVAPGRIELVYSGVDIDKFSKDYPADEVSRTKKSLGLRGSFVVGTISRLSPVKGQRFLIEAAPSVISKKPGVEFIIVGSGPEEARLKDMVKSLRLEDAVHFLSSSPRTSKFLSVMDVFILPSVKEGLGMALLEALASGKACVASDVGGVADIIKDGTSGLLVNVGDVDEIAVAILRLLNDSALRNRLGENGRILVKDKFSLNSMADKISDLYKNVLAKTGGGTCVLEKLP